MKGMVVVSAMMLVVVGVDLVAVAPGWWFLVGDVLILAGLCVLSAVMYRT